MKREYIVSIDFIGDPPENEEIVRCEDCALRFTDKCVLHDQAFPVNKGDNWFCADGEKEGR